MRAEARCKAAAHFSVMQRAERRHDGIGGVGCGDDSKGLQQTR